MNKKIVIYDGKCSFCLKCKKFIEDKSSKKDTFHLISIHSAETLEFLKQKKIDTNNPENLNMIYFFDTEKNKTYKAGPAGAKICQYLVFPYKIFYFLSLPVPNFILNFLYKRLAGLRKKFK